MSYAFGERGVKNTKTKLTLLGVITVALLSIGIIASTVMANQSSQKGPSNSVNTSTSSTQPAETPSVSSNTVSEIATVDTEKPTGTVTYTGGGVDTAGVRYIKSINELNFTESTSDNLGVVRSTFLVQKYDTDTSAYTLFCGNWNASSTGSQTLGGGTTETRTTNASVCRGSDTSPWPDGKYKIFHAAYDAAGNEGKYNTQRQEFVIDNEKPVGSATYSGGKVVNNIRYIKAIDELNYTEEIKDNNGVVRATIVVQKLNETTNKYEGFCGNWNKNSLGSHPLNGGTSVTFTGDVKVCRSNDTSAWPNGKYRIIHGAYDAAGNEGKYNTQRQEFVIDNEKPVGTATYSGGMEVAGVRYIKSIDELKYTETISDNDSVVRATVLVQKFDETSEKYEGFCGNWNKNSLGSHPLNGGKTETFTGDVKVCRSNDTSAWPDGRYRVFHGAYDNTGNEGKYNTPRQEFVIDTQKPVGTATYDGGQLVGTTRYIKTIDELSYTETINDDNGVVRATVLVQKFNETSEKYEGFCGNWNKNSLGSHPLNGSTSVTFTSGVKVCRSNDTSPWPDGRYRVFHGAYDAAGNEGKYNTQRQEFVIDNTAPAQIAGLQIEQDGQVLGCYPNIQNRDIVVNWNDITDPNFKNYQYQADKEAAEPIEFNAYVTNSERAGTIRDLDGTYNYRVRAIDLAGNAGDWSEWCGVILNRTTATIVTPVTPPATTDGGAVLGETTTANTPVSNNIARTATSVQRPIAFAGNVAAGVVLGAETTASSETPQTSNQASPTNYSPARVLGASNTNTTNVEANSCGKILGVCWYYWVPVIIVLPAIIYAFSNRQTKEHQNSL